MPMVFLRAFHLVPTNVVIFSHPLQRLDSILNKTFGFTACNSSTWNVRSLYVVYLIVDNLASPQMWHFMRCVNIDVHRDRADEMEKP